MPRLLRSVLHPEYVVLSFAIAFIGCYCGIHLCEQFRLCSKENKPKILGKNAIMMMMAISIGGVAIWARQFNSRCFEKIFERPKKNPGFDIETEKHS